MTATWQSFYAANPRGIRIAELWTRDAIAWLRAHSELHADSAVLDFGCGYFDLGLALATRVARMDGLEIDGHSLELARSRTAGMPKTEIYSANDSVPAATYDWIIVNSVFQYLSGDDEVLATLKRFRTWLKPGGAGRVMLVDLIPTRYSPARDALRSMWVSLGGLVPITMLRFLWGAATSGRKNSWMHLDPPHVAELARAAGFDCTRLPRNLSPSLQRGSYELKAIGN